MGYTYGMLDILRRPHYRFWVPWDPARIDFFRKLEEWVPGALCYAKVQGRRFGTRYRDQPMQPMPSDHFDYTEVVVSVLGAWRVEEELEAAGIQFKAVENMVGYEDIDAFPLDPKDYEALTERGRALMKGTNLLYPRLGLDPHPWQFAGVAWAQDRPAVLKTWPCGKGKTLGVMMDMESLGYVELGIRNVIIAPVAAEGTWWREIRRHTGIDPFIHVPASRQRSKDEPLVDWRKRCKANGWPEFHIYGLETLADWREDIEQLGPHTMTVDELHEVANPKAWKAVAGPDGSIQYETKTTSNGNELRSVALMNLSGLGSIERRWGMSATPLGEGRTRRLFTPLYYMWPGGVGYSYYKYSLRYCDRKEDPKTGFPTDKGSSNVGELKERCAWFEHEVTIDEARRGKTADAVMDIFFLEPHALVKEGRFSDQETYNQAIRRLGMEVDKNPLDYEGKVRLVEARLAQAASRKRQWVIDEVVRCLRGGEKALVFTTRILEAEVWAERIKAVLGQGDMRVDAPVWTCHGGKPDRWIDETVEDTFPAYDGPCAIVGTMQKIGQSKNGMQHAAVGIAAQLPWQADQLDQAFGRVDRPGGPFTVFKVPIAVGTYDEVVAGALAKKFSTVGAFMQSGHLSEIVDRLQGIEDDATMMDEFIKML